MEKLVAALEQACRKMEDVADALKGTDINGVVFAPSRAQCSLLAESLRREVEYGRKVLAGAGR